MSKNFWEESQVVQPEQPQTQQNFWEKSAVVGQPDKPAEQAPVVPSVVPPSKNTVITASGQQLDNSFGDYSLAFGKGIADPVALGHWQNQFSSAINQLADLVEQQKLDDQGLISDELESGIKWDKSARLAFRKSRLIQIQQDIKEAQAGVARNNIDNPGKAQQFLIGSENLAKIVIPSALAAVATGGASVPVQMAVGSAIGAATMGSAGYSDSLFKSLQEQAQKMGQASAAYKAPIGTTQDYAGMPQGNMDVIDPARMKNMMFETAPYLDEAGDIQRVKNNVSSLGSNYQSKGNAFDYSAGNKLDVSKLEDMQKIMANKGFVADRQNTALKVGAVDAAIGGLFPIVPGIAGRAVGQTVLKNGVNFMPLTNTTNTALLAKHATETAAIAGLGATQTAANNYINEKPLTENMGEGIANLMAMHYIPMVIKAGANIGKGKVNDGVNGTKINPEGAVDVETVKPFNPKTALPGEEPAQPVVEPAPKPVAPVAPEGPVVMPEATTPVAPSPSSVFTPPAPTPVVPTPTVFNQSQGGYTGSVEPRPRADNVDVTVDGAIRNYLKAAADWDAKYGKTHKWDGSLLTQESTAIPETPAVQKPKLKLDDVKPVTPAATQPTPVVLPVQPAASASDGSVEPRPKTSDIGKPGGYDSNSAWHAAYLDWNKKYEKTHDWWSGRPLTPAQLAEAAKPTAPAATQPAPVATPEQAPVAPATPAPAKFDVESTRTTDSLAVTRIGEQSEGGNYYGIEGQTQYEGGNRHTIKPGSKVANLSDPAVADAVIDETLKDPNLTPEERARLEEAKGQGDIDYMLFDETPMADAARRLGLDAVKVIENQDMPGSPSSVFVLNNDAVEAAKPQSPERQSVIDRVLHHSRVTDVSNDYKVVPSIQLKGSNGNWYAPQGFPHGVNSTGEKRIAGYVYESPDGRTFGKLYPTEAEARTDLENTLESKQNQFRQSLESSTDERLKSQDDFWKSEFEKKQRLTGKPLPAFVPKPAVEAPKPAPVEQATTDVTKSEDYRKIYFELKESRSVEPRPDDPLEAKKWDSKYGSTHNHYGDLLNGILHKETLAKYESQKDKPVVAKPEPISEDSPDVVAAKYPNPNVNLDEPLPESGLEKFYRDKATEHDQAVIQAAKDNNQDAIKYHTEQAAEMRKKADAVKVGDNEQAVKDSQGIARNLERDENGNPVSYNPDVPEPTAPAETTAAVPVETAKPVVNEPQGVKDARSQLAKLEASGAGESNQAAARRKYIAKWESENGVSTAEAEMKKGEFNLAGESATEVKDQIADTTGDMVPDVKEPAYVAQARTQLAKLEKSGKEPRQQETLRETIAKYEADQKAKAEVAPEAPVETKPKRKRIAKPAPVAGEPPEVTMAKEREKQNKLRAVDRRLLDQYENDQRLLNDQFDDPEFDITKVSDEARDEFLARFNKLWGDGMQTDTQEKIANYFGKVEEEKDHKTQNHGNIVKDIRASISDNKIAIPTLPAVYNAKGLETLAQFKNLFPLGTFRNPPGTDVKRAARRDFTHIQDMKDKADGMISDLAMSLAGKGWTQLDPGEVSNPMDVLIGLLNDASLGNPTIPDVPGLGSEVDTTNPRLYTPVEPAQGDNPFSIGERASNEKSPVVAVAEKAMMDVEGKPMPTKDAVDLVVSTLGTSDNKRVKQSVELLQEIAQSKIGGLEVKFVNELVGSMSGTVGGVYHNSARVIEISIPGAMIQTTSGARIAEIFAHEMVHYHTLDAIRYDRDYRYEVNNLLSYTKQWMENNGIKVTDHYGMTNEREFISEAITNPAFRKLLKGIPSLKGANNSLIPLNKTKLSVYNKLVKSMKDMFLRNGVNVDGTVLEDVINSYAYAKANMNENNSGTLTESHINRRKIGWNDPNSMSVLKRSTLRPGTTNLEGEVSPQIGNEPAPKNEVATKPGEGIKLNSAGLTAAGLSAASSLSTMDMIGLASAVVGSSDRVFPGLNPIVANMHLIAEDTGSGTALAVANMFGNRGGNTPEGAKETYDSELKANARIFKGDLARAFEPLAKLSEDQIRAKNETLAAAMSGEITLTGPDAEVVKRMKELADSVHEYAREAGVELGYVEDYGMPHSFDVGKVLGDEQAFLEAATKAYQTNNPLRIRKLKDQMAKINDKWNATGKITAEQMKVYEQLKTELDELAKANPEVQAEELLNGISFGNEGGDMTLGLIMKGEATATNTANFLKGRTFEPPTRKILRSYFNNDPRYAWNGYINRMTKIAEFARRFGNDGSKWTVMKNQMRKEGMTNKQITDVRNMILDSIGALNPRPTPNHALANSLLGLNNMSKLKTTAGTIFLESQSNAMAGNLVDGVTAPIHMLGNFMAHVAELTPSQRATFKKYLGFELNTETGSMELARICGLIDAVGVHDIMENSAYNIENASDVKGDTKTEKAARGVSRATGQLARSFGLEAAENSKRATATRYAVNRLTQHVSEFLNDNMLARAYERANPGAINPFTVKNEARMRLRRAGISDANAADFCKWWQEAVESGDFNVRIADRKDPMAAIARKAIRMESSRATVTTGRTNKMGGKENALASQDTFFGKAAMSFLGYPATFREQVFRPMAEDVKKAWKGYDAEGKDATYFSAYERARMGIRSASVIAMAAAAAVWIAFRTWFNGDDDAVNKLQATHPLKKIQHDITYTGVTGGKSEFVSRAEKGQFVPIVDSAARLTRDLNLPDNARNTKERAVAKESTRSIGVPALQAISSTYLPLPIAAVVNQILGRKEFEAAAVDLTAGEKQPTGSGVAPKPEVPKPPRPSKPGK